MFEQRTSVAWPLSLPTKEGLHLSLNSVQYPRGSFLAGQGNTAQLSGFIRTSPSHNSEGEQLFRQSPGRDSLWQLCGQMDPAATSPVCCLTPPSSQPASRWTASKAAAKAAEQGGSLRAWKARNSSQSAHQLRANSLLPALGSLLCCYNILS